MGNSDIAAADIQEEIIAPIIIKGYREQVTKRMKDDKYMLILAMYIDSVFQDFESFLRTQVDLVEDDIRLVLVDYNSSFNTYGFEAGNYTLNDNSKAFSKILQPENDGYHNAIDTEIDDITMKTK